MEDKDHNPRIAMEVKFVITTREDLCAKMVAGVIFVSTTSKDQNAKIAVGVNFVGTTSKDQDVKIVARGQICEHNKVKSQCKDCNPLGVLAGVVRGRVYIDLKNDKEMSFTEYLGCNIEAFKKHIEKQFTEGMSWGNYGEWHINHKIPLKYNKTLLEEVAQRLHYTNIQPM